MKNLRIGRPGIALFLVLAMAGAAGFSDDEGGAKPRAVKAEKYFGQLVEYSRVVGSGRPEERKIVLQLNNMVAADIRIDEEGKRKEWLLSFSRFNRDPDPRVRCYALDAQGKIAAKSARGTMKLPDSYVDELREMAAQSPSALVQAELDAVAHQERALSCQIESAQRIQRSVPDLRVGNLGVYGASLENMLSEAERARAALVAARAKILATAELVPKAAAAALTRMARAVTVGERITVARPTATVPVFEIFVDLEPNNPVEIRLAAAKNLADYAFEPAQIFDPLMWPEYESILLAALSSDPKTSTVEIQAAVVSALWGFVRPGRGYIPDWLRRSDPLKAALAEILFSPDPARRNARAEVGSIYRRIGDLDPDATGSNGAAFESVFSSRLSGDDAAAAAALEILDSLVPRSRQPPLWLGRAPGILLPTIRLLLRDTESLRTRAMLFIGDKIVNRLGTSEPLDQIIAEIFRLPDAPAEAVATALYILHFQTGSRELPKLVERSLVTLIKSREKFSEAGIAVLGNYGIHLGETVTEMARMATQRNGNFRLLTARALFDRSIYGIGERETVVGFLEVLIQGTNGVASAARLASAELRRDPNAPRGKASAKFHEAVSQNLGLDAEKLFLAMCQRRAGK